jgi:hypothetical protein
MAEEYRNRLPPLVRTQTKHWHADRTRARPMIQSVGKLCRADEWASETKRLRQHSAGRENLGQQRENQTRPLD